MFYYTLPPWITYSRVCLSAWRRDVCLETRSCKKQIKSEIWFRFTTQVTCQVDCVLCIIWQKMSHFTRSFLKYRMEIITEAASDQLVLSVTDWFTYRPINLGWLTGERSLPTEHGVTLKWVIKADSFQTSAVKCQRSTLKLCVCLQTSTKTAQNRPPDLKNRSLSAFPFSSHFLLRLCSLLSTFSRQIQPTHPSPTAAQDAFLSTSIHFRQHLDLSFILWTAIQLSLSG